MIRKITGTLALLFVLNAAPALASTHTWTGAVNQSWSVAGNWTGGAPTSGELGGTVVSFPAGSTSTMDVRGLVVDQINFTGSGSTIGGSTPLGIDGAQFITDVNDANGGNTIAVGLTLTGATSVQTSVSTGQLTISGVIAGSSGLTKTGPGTLFLHETGNTYTGVTDVQEGLVTLTASVDVSIPGPLVIGTGAGGPGSATVRDLTFGNDIAATSNVTVNSDGVLDLSTGATAEHVAGLTVNGGSVTLGAISLTLTGPLAMTGGAISGSSGALRLGGDVTATSSAAGPATISAPIALDGARTFTVTQGAQTPDLAVSNVVSDGTAPASLSKAGTGTLAISGSASNTYTGGTTVQAGTVTLNQTLGVSIPGAVTIGGGGAPGGATLRELQSSDLSATANVTVNPSGVFDLNGHSDVIAALTVNGGSVLLASPGSLLSIAPAGSVTMAGGTIAGPGGHLFLLNGGLTATSSAQGPATISAPTVLTGTGPGGLNPTFTVTAGSAPELVLSGAISEGGGAHGLIKAGAGTLESTGAETYTGTTAIAGGTFAADGQIPAPIAVAPQGTLTGHGILGPVTVAGTLTPQVGLRTGPLSFSAGGSFDFAIPSTDPSTMPTVTSSGPVAIDPAAVLAFTAAPGLTVAGGAIFPAITNTGAGTTTGAFGGGPFKTPDGVPVTANDAGGDGNDLVLTAANVAPVAGSISATPAAAHPGQAVAFKVSPSDANRDKLTTTWSFGDGTSGAGPSASHAYRRAGTYRVVATISDGAAKVRASRQIAITKPAFTSLSVKSRQTGTTIAGSLKVLTAGSTLKLTLQIPAASAASSKSSSKKPVTIGTATVKKLKSGKHAFAVKLNARGLKAQKKHKTLKVTLFVSVTPHGGTATTASKAVTLTRAAAKKRH
jgi:autotransporter-associated beta strand protein